MSAVNADPGRQVPDVTAAPAPRLEGHRSLAPFRGWRTGHPLQRLAASPVNDRAVVDLLAQEHGPVHGCKLPRRTRFVIASPASPTHGPPSERAYTGGMRAAQLARLVPDCAVLFSRLARDRRVARRHKLVLLGAGAYLAMPFDLVPDFIPVAGQLDDVIIVALVLRHFVGAGGEPLMRELWPGPERSLGLVLRLAHRL
jgi:uncharacterized membrane protein YkvA (DUF1232 family)